MDAWGIYFVHHTTGQIAGALDLSGIEPFREDDLYRGVRQDTEIWAVLAPEWRAARQDRGDGFGPGH